VADAPLSLVGEADVALSYCDVSSRHLESSPAIYRHLDRDDLCHGRGESVAQLKPMLAAGTSTAAVGGSGEWMWYAVVVASVRPGANLLGRRLYTRAYPPFSARNYQIPMPQPWLIIKGQYFVS
jgi:hypothetical protein